MVRRHSSAPYAPAILDVRNGGREPVDLTIAKRVSAADDACVQILPPAYDRWDAFAGGVNGVLNPSEVDGLVERLAGVSLDGGVAYPPHFVVGRIRRRR